MAAAETISEARVKKEATAGFLLALIGGFLILVDGAVIAGLGAKIIKLSFITFPSGYVGISVGNFWTPNLLIAFGAVGLALGMLVIFGSVLIRQGYLTEGGVVVIIFSTFSIFTGGGFIVGFILGVIGGILGIKAPKVFIIHH